MHPSARCNPSFSVVSGGQNLLRSSGYPVQPSGEFTLRVPVEFFGNIVDTQVPFLLQLGHLG